MQPDPVERAASLTVGDMLCLQVTMRPDAVALVDEDRQWTYQEFNDRVNRLANALATKGIRRGDRVAILSENRIEYVDLLAAAAKLGAIVCALSWRLGSAELQHCIRLTTPSAVVVSPVHAQALQNIDHGVRTIIPLGETYDSMLGAADSTEPAIAAEPEDGLLILYTSGTTGLPKGALISHRAELARMQTNCIDLGMTREGAFVAWPPMFHMVSTDQILAMLCLGGRTIIVDGCDTERLVDIIESERIWWLPLIPGTVEIVIEAMKRRPARPRGIQVIGAMADLVPPHQIAEITTLLQAPFLNSFGATETGAPPATVACIPIGVVPETLSKTQNSMGRSRLVDENDNDVPVGVPGELIFRGPTLFSGYWNAPETNEKDFRGGWFHLGDMFIRKADGTLDFVDRVKYMIKSGGENIYPAEIERVLLSDPRVDDAVIVRQPDPKWGEVPIAFVARNDELLTEEELLDLCSTELASYKRPKEIRFIALEEFPRSTTGKIQRHEMEKWLRS